MNKQFLFRAIAAIVVILAVNINVRAQVGGALNRARNAVEQNVKENTSQTQQQQQQQQTQTQQEQQQSQPQQPTLPTQQSAPAAQPQQTARPSDAAVAADPRASIQTVEEGYTKSPAAIRVAYEALDAQKYFRPYHDPKLKRYYFLNDSKAELDFFEKSAKTLDEFRSLWRKISYFYEGRITLNFTGRERALQSYTSFNSAAFSIIDTIPAGNRTPWGCFDDCVGVMPVGIHVVHAGFALFTADPAGLKPFMRFVEARNAAIAFDPDIISVKGNALSTGEKLPANWSDLVQICEKFYEFEELARTVTPISVIKEAATIYRDQLAKYDAAKDVGNTRYYFHLFELAMYYWQQSANFNKDAPDYDALFVEYVRYARRYEEWAAAATANQAPVNMPRTYQVDAALAAKALEVAQKQFTNFKVDRVVFLNDNWNEARETAYRNRVTQRARLAGLLTNENGKWFMRSTWLFIQSSDLKGGWTDQYRFQGGDGDPLRAQPVNYKP